MDTPTTEAPIEVEKQLPADAPVSKELPAELQLTELDLLRLKASNSALGRLVAELQLLQIRSQQMQEQIEQRTRLLNEQRAEQGALLDEVGARAGVGAQLRRYQIDLTTGRAALAPVPGPERAPVPGVPRG